MSSRLIGFLGAAAGLFVAGAASAADIKVASIYTVPVQQKWVGTLHKALTAAEERGDIDYTFSESVAPTDYIRVLREYAEAGDVDLIMGEAFGIEQQVREVAADYPEIAFLMGSSGGPEEPNVAVFDNWIHEGTYLMGILAGHMTETDKIGMVGGYPIGEVNRLFHAFMDGAESVNPDVQFKVSFIGSWYDPPKAKEFAFAQIEGGVDVIYAERAGVVDAAREKGVLAFGNVNDMNREEAGESVVVTSALWHMEPAIDHAIEQVRAGSFAAEDYKEWTMMAKGGTSLAPYYGFDEKIPAEAKQQVEEAREKILSGELEVETNDEQPQSTF
jgi:basic membrane protein A